MDCKTQNDDHSNHILMSGKDKLKTWSQNFVHVFPSYTANLSDLVKLGNQPFNTVLCVHSHLKTVARHSQWMSKVKTGCVDILSK